MRDNILQELTRDIAFRLRVQSSILRNLWYGNDDLNIYDEAADEIERLRAEITKLKTPVERTAADVIRDRLSACFDQFEENE